MEIKMSMEAQVVRISLPDQVVATLRREILTGVYQAGDNLPPERELSERFGVSRVTLRKALMILAREGWLDVVQGRSNAIKDFRTSVGIEVLPELLISCPEVLVKPPLLEMLIENSAGLCTQILVAASRKARPSDLPRLLELLARQTHKLPLTEFYENEFYLYHEFLRISDNLVLSLAYNSQVKLFRKLLAQGLIRERPYPLPRYHEINRSLIEAVCGADERKIQSLMAKYKKDMKHAFNRFFRNMGIELSGRD